MTDASFVFKMALLFTNRTPNHRNTLTQGRGLVPDFNNHNNKSIRRNISLHQVGSSDCQNSDKSCQLDVDFKLNFRVVANDNNNNNNRAYCFLGEILFLFKTIAGRVKNKTMVVSVAKVVASSSAIFGRWSVMRWGAVRCGAAGPAFVADTDTADY